MRRLDVVGLESLQSDARCSQPAREHIIFYLRRVHAEGYKALDPVDLRLSDKLLFLIGSNGAGKSSTLQALAFLQFFASGQSTDFFAERNWEDVLAVRARTVEKAHNTLRYHLLFESGDTRVLWQFAWGLGSRALVSEQMWILRPGALPRRIFRFDRRHGLIKDNGEEIKGLITPSGTILSVIDPISITPEHDIVRQVLNWCVRITSLELLSPVAMRSNVRGTPKGIGTRGQRLAGFLAALDSKTKVRIVDRLRDFYPLDGLSTTRKKAGWVDLRISESFDIGPIAAQHLSDGFLRLLALCAIPEFGSRSSMVLLDEIEDGIEPHILPRLIERIVQDSSAQFVMTSHSPLLINFFDPADVVLVTRNKEGRARFTPMNDLEVVKEGLEYLGPGEIWANAGLSTLNEQAVSSHSVPQPVEINKFGEEWVKKFMEAS